MFEFGIHHQQISIAEFEDLTIVGKNTIKAGGSTATKMWTGWVMGDG